MAGAPLLVSYVGPLGRSAGAPSHLRPRVVPRFTTDGAAARALVRPCNSQPDREDLHFSSELMSSDGCCIIFHIHLKRYWGTIFRKIASRG